MIPQPFPPSPFPPFLPSPFPPHAGLICRVLASVWLHLVYKSFFPYISYTSTHCGVPTVPSIPFRTAEAPPVYQPCPPSRSVPQKPLPCTNRAPHPVPYLRSPSRVPTVPLIPFRTAEAPPVYQLCPSPRSVPQKPLPCTNRVPPSRSVPQKPLPCTNRAPHLVLCRESTLFEPNSAHYI